VLRCDLVGAVAPWSTRVAVPAGFGPGPGGLIGAQLDAVGHGARWDVFRFGLRDPDGEPGQGWVRPGEGGYWAKAQRAPASSGVTGRRPRRRGAGDAPAGSVHEAPASGPSPG